MSSENPHNLDPHQVRAVAVEAVVSPRTVLRYLANKPTRATTATRVRRALRELGFTRAAESVSPSPAMCETQHDKP